MRYVALTLLLAVTAMFSACSRNNSSEPTFTLAWSEYPSWSVFGVAKDMGVLDELCRKHGVKVEFKLADYDTCITMYGSSTADAVCITNIDALKPALSRKSVAILPTSTSAGGDALVALTSAKTKEEVDAFLRATPVYGLEKSVSEYAFYRCCEKSGLDPSRYKFVNMDPAAAATAMQTGGDIKAIMVWNPFVLQTLRTVPKATRLFDSSLIPGEIIDMVVVGNDSLHKPGGDRFAKVIVEAYYRVNGMLTTDKAYVALGSKFCNLGATDMRQCCQETRFFGTPQQGLAVFESAEFGPVMQRVHGFCKQRGILQQDVTYGVNQPGANLNFSTTFLR